MAHSDPTRRFSNRVEDYVRYRPRYPRAVVSVLARHCGLSPVSVVADVGSGTGILSELLLRAGCRVYGVEPNLEMRQAGEWQLRRFPAFESVNGRAEATTLPTASIDLVTAGQAFHWFDGPRARAEFARILVPRGWVALMWNKRRKTGTPFLKAYERLLQRWSLDYADVDHERVTDAVIAAFFAPAGYAKHTFPNEQRLDLAAIRGRLESSSYAPPPGHPHHEPMLEELRTVFANCSEGGRVTLSYDTVLYRGRLENG